MHQQQRGKILLLTVLFFIKGSKIYCNDLISADEPQQRGLDLKIEICTSQGNCQPEAVGLVMDYSYFCEDPTTCYVV